VSGAASWWAARNERELGPRVAALARPGDIRMISSVTCPICAAARAWLTAYRIPYSECQIETDAQCRADFDASGAPGTPVIRVRGRLEVGFDPRRVQAALTPAG
ncbi:MAG: hypothetical protein KGJ30_20840, partial [Burkholderiales bacterium]|nr:hypothetical protein [Burkholderiales bacterium]